MVSIWKVNKYYLVFLKNVSGFITYLIASNDTEVKIQNNGKILKQQKNFFTDYIFKNTLITFWKVKYEKTKILPYLKICFHNPKPSL